LERNPEKRCSVQDLFEMPWIKDFYIRQCEKEVPNEGGDIQTSIHKNLVKFGELN